MRRASTAVLLVFLVFFVVACTSTSPSADTEAEAEAAETPSSETPFSTDAQGKGSMDGVEVSVSQDYAVRFGLVDAETRNDRTVTIAVPHTLRGIETELIVQMPYGDEATYRMADGETRLLSEAVDDGAGLELVNQVANIKFHSENDRLVLDELWVPKPPADQEVRADSRETTASEALLNVDSDGNGSFDGARVEPGDAYPIVARSAENSATKAYAGHVIVGAPGAVNGIPIDLLVPMWYGEKTTYQVADGATRTITDAVDDGSIVWWGNPYADITFHIENDLLVLDSLWLPRDE